MNKDKDLDDLFKKRLDDPVDHIGYDENDWMAMEQMLDKQKRRGIIYWLPIISSVAALLLIALGWWIFRAPSSEVIPKNQLQAVNHHQQTKIDTVKAVQQTAMPAPAAPKPAVNTVTTTPVQSTPAQSFAAVSPVGKHRVTGNGGINNVPVTASVNPNTVQNTAVKTTDNGELINRPGTELVASTAVFHAERVEEIATLPVNGIQIPKSAYAKVAAESADGKIK